MASQSGTSANSSEESRSEMPAPQVHVDAYHSPKMPIFSRADPVLWFLQVEVTFRNARITVESTKADLVLAAVDIEVLSCVRDLLLLSPTPADIYQRVKDRIIATYASSAESNLRRLLKGQVLTDGKPSLVLTRLRNLNGGKCDDAVVKSIFMDQLSTHHREILAAAGVEELDKIALLADKLADAAESSDTHIASLSRTASLPANFIEEFKKLNARIDSLSDRMNRSRMPQRSRSNARSKSKDRSNPKN